MPFDVRMHQIKKFKSHLNFIWSSSLGQPEPYKWSTMIHTELICKKQSCVAVSNYLNIYHNSYLKSIKTVAGIRKISLQAMNFRIFCWLAFSFSKRFLKKGTLFELRAFKEEEIIYRKHKSYTYLH